VETFLWPSKENAGRVELGRRSWGPVLKKNNKIKRGRVSLCIFVKVEAEKIKAI
jgi:hypothetical protein